ncbi:MAG: L,D-transpeptidase [Armatimonadia bacterium]
MKRTVRLVACLCVVALGRAEATPTQRCTIVVNKADNSLKLFGARGELLGRYPVATGLYRCTVQGNFRVSDKHVVSKAGTGQFGTHWIGLNTRGRRGWKQVGIHGTNKPGSIGKYASLGCVRMRNADIKRLYPLVAIGSKVQIVSVVPAPPAPPPPPPAVVPTAPVPVPVVPPTGPPPGENRYYQLSPALLVVALLCLVVWAVVRGKGRQG